MRSYSIYRGQADHGVGEGPGLEVEHGEQYLAADGPLYDKDLLAAIRPWMTLDLDPLDEGALGDRLEGWSCFSEGGYSFVVRLTPAGKFDQRTAYFAHGRAWEQSFWEEGGDAAGSLGDAAAFDRPWRERERPQPFEPPAERLAGIELVRAAPRTAARVLAHLLDAVQHQGRSLMAVPVEDFHAGGALHAHIALARAALPFPFKRGCRIRIYTRRPRFFLREAGAHLVVVPQDEAESARSLSGLRMLDRQGNLQWGDPASRQAQAYAQTVVELACRRPDGLFDFSRRIASLAGSQDVLASLDVQQIPRIYRISASVPGRLEEDLKKALDSPRDFPWDLVSDRDLRGFSPSALAGILLAGAASALPLKRLQQRLLRLVSTKGLHDDLRQQLGQLLESEWRSRTPERPSAVELEKLSALCRAGLVSDSWAAGLSLKAPLSDIEALPEPAPLLEAELRSGLLQKRRLGNPELSRLAADPSLAGALAEGVLRQVLPSSWVSGWLPDAPAAAVTAFAQHFLGRPEASRRCQDLLSELFERLLQLEELPPLLREPLRLAAEHLESAEDLPAAFEVLELRRRAGDPLGNRQLQGLWTRLASIQERQARRRLVERTLQEGWESLNPSVLVGEDGSLNLPSSWEPDVADLLLAADPPVGKLNPSTMMRLCRLLKDGQELCWERLAGRIDRLLSEGEADLPTVMAELICGGGWLQWRKRTRLELGLLRSAALAWMNSPAWGSGKEAPAPIEDWDQAVSDLRVRPLTAGEAEALFEGESPLWPWILPFQQQQVEDLARISADWDALAAIRERLSPDSVPYRLRRPLSQVLQESVSFPARLPTDFLDRLLETGAAARPLPSLVLDSETLQALFPAGKPGPLGRRAGLLRQSLHQGALDSLEGGTGFQEGLQTARFLGLENDAQFMGALSELLEQQALAESGPGFSGETLDLLDDWLADAAPLPDEHHSEKAGLYFQSRGKRRLAGFLCPDLLESKTVLQGLDCLAEGRSQHPCWAELARGIPGAPLHPAARMARILRRRARRMDAQQHRRLIQNGWKTFRAAARQTAWTSHQGSGPGTVLPVLELAAVLQPHRGLGNLAVEVVELAGGNPRLNEAEWWAELVQGLQGCPRLNTPASADDWPEAAYAVVSSAVRQGTDPASASSHAGHLDAAWSRAGRILNF